MMQGEQNILWPSEVRWFAKSSGTTSAKSKFIPVTYESLEDCHYQGGKDVLMTYLLQKPESNIFSGKGLVMSGSHQINHANNETFYGDLLSLNCNQSESDYVISGLDTQETPLQITWEVNAKEVNATGLNAALFTDATHSCTPYLICGYTSCLEIAGGRQITLKN
jgi:hypothetical protein